MTDRNHEQEQILLLLRLEPWGLRKKNEKGKRGQWNKFNGDVTNRVIIAYLNRHLPPHYKAVGPGVYIYGFEKELDILIVNRDAKPLGFTNAYRKEDSRLVIEVKASGLFCRLEDIEKTLQKELELYETKAKLTVLYIAIHESRAFRIETQKAYGDRAFFLELGVLVAKKINPNEWTRFLESVFKHLAETGKPP